MFCMIYLTTDSEEEAERISKDLLRNRLIACANMFPIRSLYRWEGRIERNEEIGVMCKTRTELLNSAIERIKQIHSYEIPCIVSYRIEKGHKDYLEWIATETRKRE